MPKKIAYTTPPGTIYRIFEIYEKAELNELGEKPVFIKPENPEKKKKF